MELHSGSGHGNECKGSTRGGGRTAGLREHVRQAHASQRSVSPMCVRGRGAGLQAGDPALAAEGMAAAAAEIQRRKARDASGFSKLIKGLRGDNKAGGGSGSGSGSSGGGSSRGAPVACGAEGTGAAGPGPSSSGNSGGSGGSWRVMSQSALAAALQRRGGFSLSLRPSSVPHPEAGGWRV